MRLGMGSTPASGVAARRPRRVARTRGTLPNRVRSNAEGMAGEGASHCARGELAPRY